MRISTPASRAVVTGALALGGIFAAAPMSSAAVSPQTVERCNSTNKTWVHFYYSNGTAPWCEGNLGSWPIPGPIAYMCAGNNHGNYSWEDTAGDSGSGTFGAGEDIYFPAGTVMVVDITGWSGSSTCP